MPFIDGSFGVVCLLHLSCELDALIIWLMPSRARVALYYTQITATIRERERYSLAHTTRIVARNLQIIQMSKQLFKVNFRP
jgi:hypothetical protein